MTVDQLQVLLLSTSRSLIASLLVVGLAAVGLRLWRATIRRLMARALAHADGAPRERQLKIQTLSTVVRASGSILLMLIAGLMVLAQFVEIAPLLASAGVIGLAIGLGAQSLIRDVISGFFILLEDHFGVGDVIKVNDQYAGYVEHLDLRRTVLRNLDGWLYTIPNGEIRVVANMTREWSRMVVDVGVAYKEDVDRVTQVLQGVSDELMAHPEASPLLLERPEILGVEALAESQVTIRVLLKTLPMMQWEVGRCYRALVKKAFDREGIEIPFPHRVVISRMAIRGYEDERARRAARAV